MLTMFPQGRDTARQTRAAGREERSAAQPLISLAMSYGERAEYATHPLAKHLFTLMELKKSNLSVAADLTNAAQLLKLAEEIGPHICVLKIHVDIIEDFTPEFTEALLTIAARHHFLIFEDRKFADIGNTVQHQYRGGTFKIADWAHIVNAHSLPGDGVISGLKGVIKDRTDRGVLLIAEMSSKGNLCSAEYAAATAAMAQRHAATVMGFICQSQVSKDPGMIHFTPGIQFASPGDALGQQYRTPEQAFADDIDVIIVGRGVYEPADDMTPAMAAELYKVRGWAAYEARLASNREFVAVPSRALAP